MPIETHWANNTQSILIEKFYDVWTWQQVVEACETQVHAKLAGITHPVALIQDMNGSHWTPTTNLLKEVQTMMQTPYPANVVMLIVVSGDPSIDMLVVSAYKRYGKDDCHYQSCRTVNQAIRVALDYLG